MSITPYKYRQALARGNKYKAELLAARRELAALRRQLGEKFSEGSASTFAAVYRALGELDLCVWLNGRLDALAARREPPDTPPEIQRKIAEQYVEIARRFGHNFTVDELLS